MNIQKFLCSVLTGALVLAPSGLGQQPLIVKEGTEIMLRFAERISSKTATTDDPVNLVLADDLKVGDRVVARAGAKALGSVSNAKRAGFMGKGGELSMRLEYLKTDKEKIRLRGTRGREGDSKTGTAIALTVLFGPIGLIKKGKEIDIAEGTSLKAFVADDTTVTVAP